jgi:pilus assembly protein Flp/PilA
LIERQREFSMREVFARFLSDQSGATAIEYALIAAGIALAIVTVVQNLGSSLNTKYASFGTALK